MENSEKVLDDEFYKSTSLLEMSSAQWEKVCDGCGLCCFRKYIEGRGKKEKLIYTSIACDCLNLKTGKCTQYENRFKVNSECTHLTKKNVNDFKWLPETCSYRLLAENKELPEWHPLKTGKNVYENEEFCSSVKIQNAVHECDVEYYDDFIIKEEFTHN